MQRMTERQKKQNKTERQKKYEDTYWRQSEMKDRKNIERQRDRDIHRDKAG